MNTLNLSEKDIKNLNESQIRKILIGPIIPLDDELLKLRNYYLNELGINKSRYKNISKSALIEMVLEKKCQSSKVTNENGKPEIKEKIPKTNLAITYPCDISDLEEIEPHNNIQTYSPSCILDPEKIKLHDSVQTYSQSYITESGIIELPYHIQTYPLCEDD